MAEHNRKTVKHVTRSKNTKKSEGEIKKADVIRVIVCAVLLIAVHFLPTNGAVRFITFFAVYLASGYDVMIRAGSGLINREFTDECLLMTIASAGALCLGRYASGVIIILLCSARRLIETFAALKSRRSVGEHMDILAEAAFVETAAGVFKVRPSTVARGDVIVVSPGERVPLDGVIIEGISSLDTSPLTGDKEAKDVTVGDRAISGCINVSSPIRVKVVSDFSRSAASRILETVEESSERRSYQENLLSQFKSIYTPAVIAIALILAVVPSLITGNWIEWPGRALAFLILACLSAPLASVPLAYFCGTGSASKDGIFIKGSGVIEALSKLSVVVMNKTGTVTEGKYTVSDVIPEPGVSKGELLTTAAVAESCSAHPIAAALREACNLPRSRNSAALNIEEIQGRGVSASFNGKDVLVGNAAFMEEKKIEFTAPAVPGTPVFVSINGVYAGYILIREKVKAGARQALENLKFQGVEQTVLVTGDVHSAAKPLASSLGFDMLKAELLPSDKIEAVEYLMKHKNEKTTLAFVGDGSKDAPVMARADVGIAVGALGSNKALDASDVAIMDGDIKRVAQAVMISKKTLRITRENIIGSLAVKLLIMILCASGVLGNYALFVTALCDAGAFALSLFNSLRTLKD